MSTIAQDVIQSHHHHHHHHPGKFVLGLCALQILLDDEKNMRYMRYGKREEIKNKSEIEREFTKEKIEII